MKNHQLLSAKICLCIFAAGLTLYQHINKNNELTALQLAIPQLEKEVKNLQKENERLQYEIDRFESPLHLMELLRKPEFSHLKFPHAGEVILIPEDEGEAE
jgi:hypothetical protein